MSDEEGVPRKLSDKEVDERRQQLAAQVLKLDAMKEKNKAKKKEMREDERELEKAIKKLAHEAETGEEFVDPQEDLFAN